MQLCLPLCNPGGVQASGRRWHARLMLLVVLGLCLTWQTALMAQQVDKGGTVIWAVHESMPHFDIHKEGSYILAQPVNPLYNGLLTFDVYNNENIVGDLAERWEVTPDGKQITLMLRQGVKFHDGADFTCADAKYSVEKMTDINRSSVTLVAILGSALTSATCSDGATLVLVLKQPSAAILPLLADSHAVMMKDGIAERVDRKDPKFLVGTGPFKYKSHTPGVDFQAERNPNYWKPGIPRLDGYQAVVMSDLTKIFASFRARQLTMTGIGRHLEKPEADILKKEHPEAVVALGPRAGWDSFVMHHGKPPFNDPRVRKAVALATDREKMIEIAAEGWGVPGGFIGPHTPYGLQPEEFKKYPQYGDDMAKRQAEAKRLLAEAGHAKGLDVDLVLRRGPLYERGALSRQDDLKKVGINIKITLLDTAGYRDRTEKGEFQAYTVLSAVTIDDPDNYYARLVCNSTLNLGKYCNPEFDKLFQEQSQTFDVQKRAEITRKMEHILLKDIPDDRGFYWKSAMAYWNRVKQWPPIQGTTVFNYGKFEQVWCQGGKCM
ncbi:MAG: ABC transporter substrate-binding protein [Candidatus Tectomicrobia bacterium]|uniref:ABC transporter substrate-binding protein n=1 Tax=Tectimicrobiota bacterium TaxID=2528274 RepID=A0A937W066_UNCTE|nr:ABC transporter substrate-binding protein [Candidatus Tectomicrobia bacterium]